MKYTSVTPLYRSIPVLVLLSNFAFHGNTISPNPGIAGQETLSDSSLTVKV
jgi:hypothetical protein